MPAARLNPVLHVGWRIHRFLLRASRGRVGSRMGAFPVLLLETVGHTTGRRRSVGPSHLEEGGRYSFVASSAGEDRGPAWAKNLRARPEAAIAVRGTSLPVIARALVGEEREALFRRFVERVASSGAYRRRTSREIPVFELRSRDP